MRTPVLTSLMLSSFLAGCLAAPDAPDGEVVDRFLAEAPGASLASTCDGESMNLAWSVTAHPLVDHYVAVVSADGAELVQIDLGFDGPGSAALDATVLAACDPSCAAVLFPVDADGELGAPLFETVLGLDIDADGYLSGLCGGPDCDDGDAAVNPGGTEACDGGDNDCNGLVDDLADAPDADLQAGVCVGATKVCDGGGGWVEPDYGAYVSTYEASETSCDGLDNDCSGQADDLSGAPDADNQLGVCGGAKKVCDGSGGWTEPDYSQLSNYAETDDCDGLDNDCDDDVDDELSNPAAELTAGVCAGALKVCDATNGWVEPDYTQISDYAAIDDCDGLDNDCLGGVDDTPTANIPDAGEQFGVCAGSKKQCDGSSGWIEPDYAAINGYELVESLCDSRDNDCNDAVDDIPGAPSATNQFGICAGSVQVCDGQGGWAEPDYTQLPNYADVDDCDGLDNDCDNDVDDELTTQLADMQDGVCLGAEKVCGGLGGWVEPDYASAVADYEAVETSCDSKDNDCDGVEDVAQLPVPDSATLECWGSYVQVEAEKVHDGPWAQIVPTRNTWAYQEGFGCALDAQSVLHCWGDNDWGSLGDGTTVSRRIPAAVSGNHTFKSAAAGNWTACGIEQDDTLWCWGLGVDPDDEVGVSTPTQLGTSTWEQVDVGSGHRCGVRTDGSLWCWGYNDSGQLGDGTFTDSWLTPVRVGAESDWTQVSAGEQHTCAIRDGRLFCFGENSQRQVGHEWNEQADGTIHTPHEVSHPSAETWVDVSAGGQHTCALASDEEIYCWGAGNESVLGDGVTFGRTHVPVQVVGGPWSDVEVSTVNSCAVDTAGQAWCWGSNYGHEIDEHAEDFAYYETPHALDAKFGAGFAPGAWSSCGVSVDDGSLWCWAGHDEPFGGPGPEAPRTLTTGAVVDMDSSEPGFDNGHECVVLSTGELLCRGRNDKGQLGDGSLSAHLALERVGAETFSAVTTGADFTCAIDSAGARWCWGSNSNSRLGLVVGSPSPSPTKDETTPGTWLDLSAGYEAACGITSDQQLRCWGRNIASTPLVIGSDTWLDVSVGSRGICAINTADELHCWGNRGGSSLGGGTGTVSYADRGTAAGAWSSVTTGHGHACAIKTDQTAWCWGAGGAGQLGDGLRTDSTAPVQVPGTWFQLVAGQSSTCGRRTDGTTWCWGYNGFYGQGHDDRSSYNVTPQQVRDTPATALFGGGYRTCAQAQEYVEQTCPN
ncbi:MAG: hypothetical protein KC912_25630 [Proteobacteria bacterium]|nr:hypothetical protein [Pseudomonadota bacterium]